MKIVWVKTCGHECKDPKMQSKDCSPIRWRHFHVVLMEILSETPDTRQRPFLPSPNLLSIGTYRTCTLILTLPVLLPLPLPLALRACSLFIP